MDLKSLVLFALRVSILSTVFGFGLKTTAADLLYVVRHPGLLGRSLLAVFVIMPIVAVLLVQMFHFPPPVEVVLVALSLSPVPPILPGKETKAGGNANFGLGLLAALSLLSIAVVPASLALLGHLFSLPLGIEASAVAKIAGMSVLVPLALGVAVRAALPSVATRIAGPVALLGKVLLPLAVLALLYVAASGMWALIGTGTVIAMATFTVAGLVVGHLLGGPARDDSTVLALSTASRHPAIAVAIASANFPDQRFGPIVLLFLLVNAVVCVPYLKWQERRAAKG